MFENICQLFSHGLFACSRTKNKSLRRKVSYVNARVVMCERGVHKYMTSGGRGAPFYFVFHLKTPTSTLCGAEHHLKPSRCVYESLSMLHHSSPHPPSLSEFDLIEMPP